MVPFAVVVSADLPRLCCMSQSGCFVFNVLLGGCLTVGGVRWDASSTAARDAPRRCLTLKIRILDFSDRLFLSPFLFVNVGPTDFVQPVLGFLHPPTRHYRGFEYESRIFLYAG